MSSENDREFTTNAEMRPLIKHTKIQLHLNCWFHILFFLPDDMKYWIKATGKICNKGNERELDGMSMSTLDKTNTTVLCMNNASKHSQFGGLIFYF